MRKLKEEVKQQRDKTDWGCTHTKHGCLVPTPSVFVPSSHSLAVLCSNCSLHADPSTLHFVSTSQLRFREHNELHDFMHFVANWKRWHTGLSHALQICYLHNTVIFTGPVTVTEEAFEHTTCVPCLGLTEQGSCLQLDQSTVHLTAAVHTPITLLLEVELVLGIKHVYSAP